MRHNGEQLEDDDGVTLGPPQYRDDLRSWAGQNKIRKTYGDASEA